MPYLGEVWIDIIENENVDESSKSTDHALEDGEQITDHVNSNPVGLTISGIIIDPSDEKLLKLRKYREEGEILLYNYRSRLENVLITSFNSKKDASTIDGYTFSMSLKQIRMVKAPNVIRVSVLVKKQVKAVSKTGKKSVKKSTKRNPEKKVTSKPKPKVPTKQPALGFAGLEGRK